MVFDKNFEHASQLFEAAVSEFIAQGYRQASLNAILETAGMSKGQFYYYFKGKEDLYLALIGVMIARKQAFLASAMQPGDFKQDIFSIFKTQMRYSMEFARHDPSVSQFSESFLREKGNAIYDKALSVYNFEGNEAFTGLVDQALARGEFRDDLPPVFIHRLIAYLFTHAGDLAGLSTADQYEAGVDQLVDFIQYGLARHTRDDS